MYFVLFISIKFVRHFKDILDNIKGNVGGTDEKLSNLEDKLETLQALNKFEPKLEPSSLEAIRSVDVSEFPSEAYEDNDRVNNKIIAQKLLHHQRGSNIQYDYDESITTTTASNHNCIIGFITLCV